MGIGNLKFHVQARYYAVTEEGKAGLKRLIEALVMTDPIIHSGVPNYFPDVLKTLGMRDNAFCPLVKVYAWVEDDVLCMEGISFYQINYGIFEALARCLKLGYAIYATDEEYDDYVNTDNQGIFFKNRYVLTCRNDEDWETICGELDSDMITIREDFETLQEAVTHLRKVCLTDIQKEIEGDIEKINAVLKESPFKIHERQSEVIFTEKGEREFERYTKAYWREMEDILD